MVIVGLSSEMLVTIKACLFEPLSGPKDTRRIGVGCLLGWPCLRTTGRRASRWRIPRLECGCLFV